MEPARVDMTVLAEFTTPELAGAAAGAIIDRRIAAEVVESAPGRWSVLVPREELAAAGEAIVVPRRPMAADERLAACPECGYDLKGLGAATTCPECGYPLVLHQQRASGQDVGPLPLAPGLVRRARIGALIAAAVLLGPLLSVLAPEEYRGRILPIPALCVGVVGVLVTLRARRERRARRHSR